ncbi:MAG: YigZ family protein [Bacteroides sp.]|nr:YigZ family protein [Bacteroides sp.]
MEDRYLTIAGPAEGKIREKMSQFLSFAYPVSSREEAMEIVKSQTNRYHDARHVCWAYMLGPDRKEWQLSDNGEPSGTAGKPILGQINSRELTDVLVVVVRYFGGIKLGTSGLIAAYRQAASEALDEAGIKECFQTTELSFTFPYASANDVMKIVKGLGLEVVDQRFDNVCEMRLRLRSSMTDEIAGRLSKVSGLSLS